MTTIANAETPLYAYRLAGLGYDLVARSIYLPVGGLANLRREALAAACPGDGSRVLELGCGTGGFTRLLVGCGGRVTAVDQAPNMMARARRRAPAATFVQSDITEYRPAPAAYDLVWLAFVLHELPAASRHAALVRARTALAPGGRLVIVEHALATAGWMPRAISRFVHMFEPSTMVAWLREGFTRELEDAGFAITSRAPLARGTAVVLTATGRCGGDEVDA